MPQYAMFCQLEIRMQVLHKFIRTDSKQALVLDCSPSNQIHDAMQLGLCLTVFTITNKMNEQRADESKYGLSH